MNCKPGDLAVCIRSTKRMSPVDPLGRFCTVLYAAPSSNFTLPDGYSQRGCEAGRWVVEWQSDMWYPTTTGSRYTRYGVIPDSALRPILDPGDEVPDESIAWLPPVPYPALEGV